MTADKHINFRTGYRARLRSKFLQNKIVDYEVLELLLTYAIPRIDVRFLARELMRHFGGVHGILTAPISKLKAFCGLKENTAIFIKAINELMLLDYKNFLEQSPVFAEYKTLENYCKLELFGKSEEEFHVLYLNSQHRLIINDLHTKGTANQSPVYPREIVKRALDVNARYVILMHNHPMGTTSFSEEDINTTLDIDRMLRVMEIELFDHLLLSGTIVYSAKNMYLLQ